MHNNYLYLCYNKTGTLYLCSCFMFWYMHLCVSVFVVGLVMLVCCALTSCLFNYKFGVMFPLPTTDWNYVHSALLSVPIHYGITL